jgi:hypothetical protein
MIYVGYQVTPVPGKLDDLLTAYAQVKEIAEANGAKQIGGFTVALGPDAGSVLYIVAYQDADAYNAVGKALASSDVMKRAQSLIATASSAALRPLPDSRLQ